MLVLSMMSSVAAGDEQKRPQPPYNNSIFHPPVPFWLHCFSQRNILVLIKANKGKHSLMVEEDMLGSLRTRQQPSRFFSQ